MASDTLARTSSMARRMPSPPSATGYRPSMAKGLKSGHVAVVVDVEELGQLVVGDDRVGSTIWRHESGVGLEQVALGAEVAHGRDQLLADGVERRVGDLGEQLGEVVEQQPGRSDSTAIGVSVPIDPMGSAPVRAIGASRILSSSVV
jgi:hypothetical protein